MEGSWKGGSVFSLRAASQQCGQFRLVSFKLPLQILLQQLLAFTGHRVSEVTGDIQYAVSSGIEGKKWASRILSLSPLLQPGHSCFWYFIY